VRRTRLWAVAGVAALTAIPLVGAGLFDPGSASALTAAADAASARTTVGRGTPVPVGAARLGPAPTTAPIKIDVVLKPRDPSALARVAAAVSTPGNPQYRHFLPRGQLARAFGPTPATVASVDAALTAAGLSPGPVSADGLLIPVTTTVGRAEGGFHTRISSYRLASGRSAVANTTPASLPSSIASAVQSIIGLNTTTTVLPQSLSAPTPLSTEATTPPSAPANPTPGPDLQPGSGVQPCGQADETAVSFSGYTSGQLSTAYSFAGLYDDDDYGAGVTVALYELEPFAASDIAAFQTCYQTKVPVTTVKVDGGAGTGVGSGEAALDIENVIELAPEVKIQVYEAPNTAQGAIDDYARIASADSAQVVSTSWGLCEAYNAGSISAENTIFEEMTAQGQTIFAASGDSGSEDCVPRTGSYSMTTGDTPDAVVADPSSATVYVADEGQNDITVESEAQFAPVATVPVGADPDGITLDPDTHTVYVADGTSPGSVSVFPGDTCDATDQSACEATTISGLGDDPGGIATDPSNDTLYVANEESGTVSVVSEASDEVVGTVALGSGTAPVGVAVDTATHDVYVSDSATDAVSVIDGATCNATSQTGCGTTPPTIAVDGGAAGLAVDSATDVVYVADPDSDTVSVINGATDTVSSSVGVESDAVAVALSPSGDQVVVAGTSDDGEGGADAGRVSADRTGAGREPPSASPAKRGGQPLISVISTATDAMTASFASDKDPVAIAVDPSSGYAFTADSTGGTAHKGDLGALPLFLNADDPSSQPDVTGVGGTDLTQWTNGLVESAWGDPSDSGLGSPSGASGGGISSVFAMPAYQSSIVNTESSGLPCGVSTTAVLPYCREDPDVSASADPDHAYVVYYDHGWTAFGGTSGAAPLWAALAALAVSLNGGVQRLGNINPDLYQFAADGYPDFNDVTDGDTDFTTTNGGAWSAGSGYDMATGLGSPDAANLAPDLDPFSVTTEPTGQTVAAGQTATFTIVVSGTEEPAVQWLVSTDGGQTFSDIDGATSDTCSVVATASDSGNQYEAVVTSPSTAVTTSAATLDVVSVATTSLPDATRGQAYRVQLDAAGGTAPYVWTFTGSWPKGLKLKSNGLLSGTPKLKHVPSGTYTVTVTATTRPSKSAPSVAARQTLTLTLL
jgi:YVTN family beta-propeller protein